ncbi:MAG: pyrroline-5-carboxylate reductase [Moorellales bacterium]
MPAVGFIGAGAMGEALIKGLTTAGKVGPTEIMAADVSSERRAYLAERYGVAVVEANREVARNCPTVVLAVKPQVAGEVLAEVGPVLSAGQLLLSVVAGWTIARLQKYVSPQAAIIRAMPNTPCLIGRGITALSYGSRISVEHKEEARRVFGAVGEVVELAEEYLDAVTAVSGCGPAYAFLIIEAWVEAGVKLGLPRPVARRLALRTLEGAAAMALETEAHPAQLREMVTSPGGATAYALAVMEEAGLRGTWLRAVEAAWRRAGELGREGEE